MPRGEQRLNLEEEDEKEQDRHRWRQQQSQNDPGAKACEATCIFCVGMLFLQVAWIFYTYGVQGTMNLLMAPEVKLGSAPRTCSTYVALAPPTGYGSEVLVLHDAEAGLQRIHYTSHGALQRCCAAALRVGWALHFGQPPGMRMRMCTQRTAAWRTRARVGPHALAAAQQLRRAALAGSLRVVLLDAAQRTTRWLFYEAPAAGTASATLAACYVLANDTTLQFGMLHPRETFSQHSAFLARASVLRCSHAPSTA
jgi:hypothetical protein